MNTYSCTYFKSGPYGYFKDIALIVKANKGSSVIDMIMRKYPLTQQHLWSIENLSEWSEGITEMYSQES
jgi:hypothetical protein